MPLGNVVTQLPTILWFMHACIQNNRAVWPDYIFAKTRHFNILFEPPHGKTNRICIGENKGADQLRSNCEADQRLCFRYTIVQFLYFSNPKFQASSHLLCLYSPVCVGPVRKPHCWFSHEVAHFLYICALFVQNVPINLIPAFGFTFQFNILYLISVQEQLESDLRQMNHFLVMEERRSGIYLTEPPPEDDESEALTGQ